MTSDYDLALSFLQLKTTMGQLGPGEWRGTASDLLALLTQLGLPDPPRPNTFTCWLRTWTPLMRRIGLQVEFTRRGHRHTRLVHLQCVDRPQTTDLALVGWICGRCGFYTPGLHTPAGLVCHMCKGPAPAEA